MPNKTYKIQQDTTTVVEEAAIAYRVSVAETQSYDRWNPNAPFHGTQEEWWAHFQGIEKGQFSPVSESHQRISQWLSNQKR
jgi:uncharacterized protein with NAD-binding domain and iron-sulfur cluster